MRPITGKKRKMDRRNPLIPCEIWGFLTLYLLWSSWFTDTIKYFTLLTSLFGLISAYLAVSRFAFPWSLSICRRFCFFVSGPPAGQFFLFSSWEKRKNSRRKRKDRFLYGESRQPFGRETTKPSVISPTAESGCGERVLTEQIPLPKDSLSLNKSLLLRRRAL